MQAPIPTPSFNEAADLSSALAIDVQALSFRYPKAETNTLYIPHWQVKSGERVFLQGASGSGKSTLLQLLCGLQVGRGTLNIANSAIAKLPARKRDRFRARHIGMVFQQFNLIPYLSMLDNVVLAADLAGLASGALARAKSLLQRVGLEEDLWKQPAASLSIGQQQRVAIARALINTPEILLFDEPTSALDDSNQSLFMEVLQDHLSRQTGTTVVFVSHDEGLAQYFDRMDKMSEISAAEVDLGQSNVR